MWRKFIHLVPLGLLLAAALFCRPHGTLESAQAAEPKEVEKLKNELKIKDRELDKLRKEVAQLQGNGKDKDRTVAELRAEVARLKKTPAAATTPAKPAKDLEAMKNAPYVHAVIFYLKKDAGDGEADALIADGTKLLGKIATVRGLWIGKPADPATPDVAVKDYQVGLSVLFDNYDGLKTYLDDPLHQQFKDQHEKYWDKATVYDFSRPKP